MQTFLEHNTIKFVKSILDSVIPSISSSFFIYAIYERSLRKAVKSIKKILKLSILLLILFFVYKFFIAH